MTIMHIEGEREAGRPVRGAFAIAVAMLFVLAGIAHADDSDLVKAAKASGGPRKPSRKAITNEDVKKNATKSSGATATGEAPALSAAKNELELQADHNKARAAAEQKVRASEAHVAALENELAAIEQSYYDATDLDVRDRVITQRFTAAKDKLDVARHELGAARDAAKALMPATVIVHQ